MDETEEKLKFFKYDHLPAHLQPMSKVFADAAASIMVLSPNRSSQRTIALQKLIEAKDAGVRSLL
jgi:hypothetical protein